MQSLILHPTSIAQWQALITQAQQTSAIYLKEDIEAYLIFLLMRFIDEPSIAASVLGLDFLNGYQKIQTPNQFYHLKEVGDKCLLFAGLFPGRAMKRRVKVSYFVKLGQTAYSTISTSLNTQEALFIKLCTEFVKMMDVLHAMREFNSAIDLLQSLELWHETGSQLSWKKFCERTTALPVIPQHNKSMH